MEELSARLIDALVGVRADDVALRLQNVSSQALLAATLSSFIDERLRAKTASPIRVTGVPVSSALMQVHFPVPFWPAVSRIFSTTGVPSSSFFAKICAVMSIR